MLLAIALCLLSGSAAELRAQTRADSAAVLLSAAEQLRLRGDVDAARAVLALITDRYAGTPAAAEVARMLALLRRMPEQERPGRTELLVFGTLYGAWLGVALPLALDSDEPSAYGVGLLLGAPAGFLAARQYANAKRPTYGQARALTFGGSWGTYNGIALAEIFEWGVATETFCDEFGNCFEVETGDDSDAYVTSAVVGGLLGIATGAVLARKPITAGTAATATLGGMWGTWFGFGISFLADQRDDDLLAGTVIGGNASLLALGLIAPRWQMSESRARLISLGGLIGGLGGAGLILITEPDNDETAILFPLAGSALGLGLGAYWTRNRDVMDDGSGRGALINRSGAGWEVDLPEPSIMLRRDERGTIRPGLYVPLLSAKFQGR